MQSVLRAARWVRIFSMSSGVSMHAMTRNVPPHTPQCSAAIRAVERREDAAANR